MELDAHTTRPFRGSEAVARGDVTWARLAGPAFRPLLTDVYVGARAEVDTGTWVRAVALWGRGAGVVSGALAALAFGAECPWDDEREIVLATSRRPTSAEVSVRRDRLLPDEMCTRFGVRVTSPARTAFDLARRGRWSRPSRPSTRSPSTADSHPPTCSRWPPSTPGRAVRSRCDGWRT